MVWVFRGLTWILLITSLQVDSFVLILLLLSVAITGFFLFNFDIFGVNLIKRNVFPHCRVPSEDRKYSIHRAYFPAFSINSNYFYYTGLGKIQLTDSHFTLALVTSLPGFALCHEPLRHIERVKLSKYFLGGKLLTIQFTADAKIKRINLM